MNELHLFAGAGGGILGSILLGHRPVCAVEIEAYPRKVMLQRQRDGILPRFPIWDDITTFDGKPWKGRVDIVSGGFPCQDISAAGKGAGIEGERSGLWGEMARVVNEVRPRFVFVENSPMLTSRGLGRVLGDLSEMGYDARWCVLGADDAGAPHRRKRIWILAYSGGSADSSDRRQEREEESISGEHRAERCSGGIDRTGNDSEVLADPYKEMLQGQLQQRQGDRHSGRFTSSNKSFQGTQIRWWDSDPADISYTEHLRESQQEGVQREKRRRIINCGEIERAYGKQNFWGIESGLGRVAHGVANRIHRLKAIGNGQVSSVAAIAWTVLSEGLTEE